MKVVVNHLTRMQQGYICVAGVDLDTERHVRPVLKGRLRTSLLARNGGPFDMAVVVDLGTPTPAPQKPETEDHIFDPSQIKANRTLGASQFWKLLARLARPKLVDIFGPELVRRGGRSCAVDVGKGSASLGCLFLRTRPNLFLRERPAKPSQIRLQFSDGDFHLDCGVTDIRLYRDDHITPDTRLVEQIEKHLKGDVGLILSVGLTRPYASSPDFAPVHWLQVNNLHLQDNPTWQLG